MVKAGLTARKTSGQKALSKQEETAQESTAEKRITSFCIDAALNEDDFETAYSYVTTRLANLAGLAEAHTEEFHQKKAGLVVQKPPTILDDWSWKAALEVWWFEPPLTMWSS